MIICEMISTWWGILNTNAGAIQSILGLIAIGIAALALHKVLIQIDISNQQTNITIEQLKKYNKERFFEIGIRLREAILNQIDDIENTLKILKEADERFYKLKNSLTSIPKSKKDEDIKENKNHISRLKENVYERKLFLRAVFISIDEISDLDKLEYSLKDIYDFKKNNDDLKREVSWIITSLEKMEKMEFD